MAGKKEKREKKTQTKKKKKTESQIDKSYKSCRMPTWRKHTPMSRWDPHERAKVRASW